MCRSECTDDVLEFCCLGVIDFGQIYCMNCYTYGTQLWEKRQLQNRFGDLWEFKYQELKGFRRDVKRKVRALRRNGCNPAETIYFIDPPVNPELHADHMNFAGGHIKRPKHRFTDPLVERLTEELNEQQRKDGTMPKKYYLTDYGSHE